MKIDPTPHRWSVSPREAIAIQRSLASRVEPRRPRRRLRYIAGVDSAFAPDRCVAAVVLWDLRDGAVVEERLATRTLRFPYVPGLLSFREAPAVLAALRKLRRAPDAIICDGQGLAHPRRFGIACHLGVLVGLPAIGCAKSRLIGEHGDPGPRRGARTALLHDGERIGTVLRTRAGVKPVYVSIGHRVDLTTAERLILACATRFRLPEPIRRADHLVTVARRRRLCTRAKA